MHNGRAAVGARVGGAIDPDDKARGLIASPVFGGTSESERNRIEVRALTEGPRREQPLLDVRGR